MSAAVHLLRGLLRRWVRPDARNSLAVALLLAGHDRWPKPIEAWPERRVLVLSPHPDDEAIGCAGAVLRHVAAGADVRVLHMSDGGLGSRRLADPALTDAQRREMQAELIATRQREAAAWGEGAGVARVEFLGASDGAIAPVDTQVQRLSALLDEFRPDIVYPPFVMDLLEDHWQTSRVLDAALSRCGGWTRALVLRAYEVWAPLPANRVADITELAPRKRALLGLYASQIEDVDYRRAIEGLNTYRAMLLPATGVGQAEAFVEASLEGWRDIVRRAARPPARRTGAT